MLRTVDAKRVLVALDLDPETDGDPAKAIVDAIDSLRAKLRAYEMTAASVTACYQRLQDRLEREADHREAALQAQHHARVMQREAEGRMA